MKYSTEIDIQLPLNKVITLFDNPDNLKHWQPNLVSFEPVSGETGQPGAKSKLVYQRGKRRIEMIETITERDLPKAFSGSYETKGVFNTQQNTFIALDGHTTKWYAKTDFKFSGVMKVVALFMGMGAFRKETMKFQEQFKAFAETAT